MKVDNKHSKKTLELRHFMDTIRVIVLKVEPLYGERDEELYQKNAEQHRIMDARRQRKGKSA